MVDEKPTLAERYGRATRSSHLEVIEHQKGDVDYLIAAGWSGSDLGILLYRLATEYDRVRAEHRAAWFRSVGKETEAQQEARSVKVGPTQANKIRLEAEHNALQARAFILLELKTLDAAAQALGRHAAAMADAKGFDLHPQDVRKLAGRALDVFLDPHCPHCTGRGKHGAREHGDVETNCRPCKGSGKRDHNVGKTDTERRFAGRLLVEMEMMLSDVERGMRRVLRSEG